MLVKPINVIFIPAQPGHPAVPASTVCPDPPPPTNGSGGGGGSSGGGPPPLVCIVVPNLYGGTMQACF